MSPKQFSNGTSQSTSKERLQISDKIATLQV